jgi:hypothetical protein
MKKLAESQVERMSFFFSRKELIIFFRRGAAGGNLISR